MSSRYSPHVVCTPSASGSYQCVSACRNAQGAGDDGASEEPEGPVEADYVAISGQWRGKGKRRTWELPPSFIWMSDTVVGRTGSGSLACLQSNVRRF